jgi:AbrB family looped-hinge helix DNA binding protein
MAQKIGPKGQVVIPKMIRDRLGVRPGDEVVVTMTDTGALVQAVAGNRSMKGIFGGSKLLEILEQDHHAELE